jgi:hypothetical protein
MNETVIMLTDAVDELAAIDLEQLNTEERSDLANDLAVSLRRLRGIQANLATII